MNVLQSAIIVIAACAFTALIVGSLVAWYSKSKPTRKCEDCGYERRHDETPHEITGCPDHWNTGVERARRYIEKGQQTIGFVKHPTIDEIDHRTIGQ